jgi:hypothetical protein
MRSPSKPPVCEITFPQKPRETNEKHLGECFSNGFERYFWEGIGRKTRFQKLKTIAFSIPRRSQLLHFFARKRTKKGESERAKENLEQLVFQSVKR